VFTPRINTDIDEQTQWDDDTKIWKSSLYLMVIIPDATSYINTCKDEVA
jgi:hypothetical protein